MIDGMTTQADSRGVQACSEANANHAEHDSSFRITVLRHPDLRRLLRPGGRVASLHYRSLHVDSSRVGSNPYPVILSRSFVIQAGPEHTLEPTPAVRNAFMRHRRQRLSALAVGVSGRFYPTGSRTNMRQAVKGSGTMGSYPPLSSNLNSYPREFEDVSASETGLRVFGMTSYSALWRDRKACRETLRNRLLRQLSNTAI